MGLKRQSKRFLYKHKLSCYSFKEQISYTMLLLAAKVNVLSKGIVLTSGGIDTTCLIIMRIQHFLVHFRCYEID